MVHSTAGMQDWRDATLEGYRKGGSGMMQYGKDEAQEGFRTGGIQYKCDGGKQGFRIGGMQSCRTGEMQDR